MFNKISEQKRATIVSMLTTILLIILKIFVGLTTGTVVVLASAIDSMLDFIVSTFNFLAIRESEKPSCDKFNYGRGKAEAIAALIEGLIITISGFYIIYEAIDKINNPSNTASNGSNIALIVMTISMVITFILVRYLSNVAKKTGSMVLESDSLHYKTDLYTNAGIIISLILINLTGLQIIDSVIAIIIAVYIISSAAGIVKNGYHSLMDVSIDNEIVLKIKERIQKEDILSFHGFRTRNSGGINFIDVHVVLKNNISLIDAHMISDSIELNIMNIEPNLKWIINIHLDPFNDSEKDATI